MPTADPDGMSGLFRSRGWLVRAMTALALGVLAFGGGPSAAVADSSRDRFYEAPNGVSTEQLLAAASVDLASLPGPAFGRAADELEPVLPTVYTEHTDIARTSMIPLLLFAGQPYRYVGADTSSGAVEVRTGIDLFDSPERAAEAFQTLTQRGSPVGDYDVYGETPLQCPSGCPSVGEESRLVGIRYEGRSTARLRFRRGVAVVHVDFDYRTVGPAGAGRFVLPDRGQLLGALAAWGEQLDRHVQDLGRRAGGETVLGVTAKDAKTFPSTQPLLYLASYPWGAFPAAGPNEAGVLSDAKRLVFASYVPPASVDLLEANLVTFPDAATASAWLAQADELEQAENPRRLRATGTGKGSVFVAFDVGPVRYGGPLPPRGYTYRFRSGKYGAEVYCEEPHDGKRCEAIARGWARAWAARLGR